MRDEVGHGGACEFHLRFLETFQEKLLQRFCPFLELCGCERPGPLRSQRGLLGTLQEEGALERKAGTLGAGPRSLDVGLYHCVPSIPIPPRSLNTKAHSPAAVGATDCSDAGTLAELTVGDPLWSRPEKTKVRIAGGKEEGADTKHIQERERRAFVPGWV